VFVPKQTLSTVRGVHVSNPETDPPVPPDNDGYNFNPWGEWIGGSGNYETALAQEATSNAGFPLSVSP